MHKSESQIIEEFSKKLIDSLIEQSKDITIATHWGEPSILLCDIINMINNEAQTDYKRYTAYSCKLKSEKCKPDNTNPWCYMCRKHWTHQDDKTSKECLGTTAKGKKPCEEYIGINEIE